MIHYTPEGQTAKIGLNVTLGQWRKPWISFRWVWYDTIKRTMSSRRLRIRPYMRPFVIASKDEYNVVHGYMWERNVVVIDAEELRDLCSDAGVKYETYVYKEQ